MEWPVRKGQRGAEVRGAEVPCSELERTSGTMTIWEFLAISASSCKHARRAAAHRHEAQGTEGETHTSAAERSMQEQPISIIVCAGGGKQMRTPTYRSARRCTIASCPPGSDTAIAIARRPSAVASAAIRVLVALASARSLIWSASAVARSRMLSASPCAWLIAPWRLPWRTRRCGHHVSRRRGGGPGRGGATLGREVEKQKRRGSRLDALGANGGSCENES